MSTNFQSWQKKSRMILVLVIFSKKSVEDDFLYRSQEGTIL